MTLKGRYITIAVILAIAAIAFIDTRYGNWDESRWLNPVDTSSVRRDDRSFGMTDMPTAVRKGHAAAEREGAKELAVDNPFGSTTVKGTTESNVSVNYTVKVFGSDKAEANSYIGKVRMELRREGDRLSVRRVAPPAPDSVRGVFVECVIGCPESMKLDARNHFGALEVYGMGSTVEAANSFGRTELKSIGGDTEVQSSYGDLTVVDVDGDLTARNSFARADVMEVGGDLRLTTRYGGVYVTDVDGDAAVSSHYGEVRLTSVGGKADVDTRYGRLLAEGVAGAIKARARYGDVELRDFAGGVDVESRGGKVYLSLGGLKGGYDFDVRTNMSKIHAESRLTDRLRVRQLRGGDEELSGKVGDGALGVKVRASMSDVWLND